MIDILKLREIINRENASGKKVYKEKLEDKYQTDRVSYEAYNYHGQEISLKLDSGMKMYFYFKRFNYVDSEFTALKTSYSVIGENIPYICEDSQIRGYHSKLKDIEKFDIAGPISTFIAYDYFKKNSAKILKEKNISYEEIDKIHLAERRFINIFRHAADLKYRKDEKNDDDRLNGVVDYVQETLDDCFGKGKIDLTSLVESQIENLLNKQESKSKIKLFGNFKLFFKHGRKKAYENQDEIEM